MLGSWLPPLQSLGIGASGRPKRAVSVSKTRGVRKSTATLDSDTKADRGGIAFAGGVGAGGGDVIAGATTASSTSASGGSSASDRDIGPLGHSTLDAPPASLLFGVAPDMMVTNPLYRSGSQRRLRESRSGSSGSEGSARALIDGRSASDDVTAVPRAWVDGRSARDDASSEPTAVKVGVLPVAPRAMP
jgi:hypothetical protein